MRIILATAALVALAACDSQPPSPAVEITDAVVNLPILPDRPGAAYFTLRANNDPTKIVSVTSPRVERIELHETRGENGVSKMAPMTDMTFPASGELKFEAGGRHAMLFGIDPAVKAGDRIPLIFTFDPAPAVTVQAEVRAAGGHAGH